MTFLPENYDLPKTNSKYMKLEKGANKFRVLDNAVTGYIYWNVDNKPVRQEEQFDFLPADIRMEADKDGKTTPSRIKHFWAFPVWDYSDSQVKILEITQSSIQSALKSKVENRNGVATGNDIVITRSGDGLGTDYEVDMLDASPLTPEIKKVWEATSIDLTALFRGDDPYSTTTTTTAKVDSEVDVEDIPF